MDFSDLEINPLAIGAGVVGAVISLVVMKSSPVGIFWKALGFIATGVVCYFVFDFQSKR
jgi:hypothetical protein